MVLAVDGLVCLVMAAPIALALAVLGGFVANSLNGIRNAETQSGSVLSVFLVLPLLAGTEYLAPLPTPEFKTPHFHRNLSAARNCLAAHHLFSSYRRPR